jgi:hypothetical protein
MPCWLVVVRPENRCRRGAGQRPEADRGARGGSRSRAVAHLGQQLTPPSPGAAFRGFEVDGAIFAIPGLRTEGK